MNKLLIPEWALQIFVQVAWPHADTDWSPYLEEACRCFESIVRTIAAFEDVLIVSPEPEAVRLRLGDISGVHYIACPTNDTWTRDTGFLTLSDGSFCDFQFNGWGMKFAACHDNRINARIFPEMLRTFYQAPTVNPAYTDRLNIVLEGGSVESDGCGTILTTTSCLFAPNRNGFRSKKEADDMLRQALGALRVLWLDHGHLEGDDTDGHIDTLARLCPDDTILYIRCDNPADTHYEDLKAMEQELQAFRTADGRPYRLLPLPMAAPMYDDGERLPATYANYLVINGAVLLPTYGQTENDREAARQLQTAFPDRKIIPIDCQILVRQHGSLHCSTMQFPAL